MSLSELDKTDCKILEILQKDARITNKDLASQLGLSPPPTLERVKKLENAGYITGYSALLNPVKIDLGTVIVVTVSLHHHSEETINSFHHAIDALDEVLECYHLTGDDDFMLKIICKDIAEYEQFVLKRLVKLSSLGKIKSSVVLSTTKKSDSYPIRKS